MNRSAETSNIVFNINDESDRGDLLAEVLQTEIGQRFVKDYLVREKIDESTPKIIAAIQENAKNPAEVEVDEAARILDILMEAGKFVPKVLPPELPVEAPPEPVDDRPRDKNGKLLTQAQQDWSEMTRFLAEHSMEEVNLRRRADPKFRSFCEHNLKTEMQQGVGDAVTPVGEPEKRTRAGIALTTFAREYQKASTSSLRAVNGMVTLASEAVPVDVFNSLLVRARQAGLI